MGCFHDGVELTIEGFRALKERFPAWVFTLRAVEEHTEECVLCEGSIRVTTPDGSSEAADVFWVIRMGDGRIVEVSSFDRRKQHGRHSSCVGGKPAHMLGPLRIKSPPCRQAAPAWAGSQRP